MPTTPTQSALYEIFKNEAQSRAPNLTDFSEGSNLDALGGGFSLAGAELVKFITDNFNNTFFSTASGSVNGKPDYLELLAVDHFGNSFARPQATNAVATVEFSRANTDAGNVLIPAGTVVKTAKNAEGEEFRFETISSATMSGLDVEVNVRALAAGVSSNAAIGAINIVDTALTDPSVVVTNDAAAVGGAAAMSDPAYLDFLRNKIIALRGATLLAIEAAAANVPGVAIAKGVEDIVDVKEWDIGMDDGVGDPFELPRGTVYIADGAGSASDALIQAVHDALIFVRACGVYIRVKAATLVLVDVSATITLDAGGANFAELSSNPQRIINTITQYVKDLGVGVNFSRAAARTAILNVWGAAGTGDLVDLQIVVPSGDVVLGSVEEKFMPDTVEIL